MAINFIVQSRKDYAPITVRYTDTHSDAKTRTQLYIEKSRLVKSKVIKYKYNSTLSAIKKTEIKEKNLSLEKVELGMKKIERLIYDAINELPDHTIITSKWLKMVVNQTNAMSLKSHIDNWVKSKESLSENSILASKSFQNFMNEHFDCDIPIKQIDLNYFDFFKDKLKADYSARTINTMLTYLVAVCKYAEDRGTKLSFKRDRVKRLKQKKAIKSYLTFEDLKKIQEFEFTDLKKISSKDLEASRDWLIISCYTAMRSIDIYNLTNANIQKDYIVFKQQKTDSNDVYVPITTPVRNILNKYNGFPPKDITQTKSTWGQRYERHIKKVCKLAGVNQLVDYKIKNKVVKTEKYNTITTHIGRMSFATNFYGKMPTTDVMAITGHSSEQQLLTYINKNRVTNHTSLYDKMNEIIG